MNYGIEGSCTDPAYAVFQRVCCPLAFTGGMVVEDNYRFRFLSVIE
jgi:hypothetical protein